MTDPVRIEVTLSQSVGRTGPEWWPCTHMNGGHDGGRIGGRHILLVHDEYHVLAQADIATVNGATWWPCLAELCNEHRIYLLTHNLLCLFLIHPVNVLQSGFP